MDVHDIFSKILYIEINQLLTFLNHHKLLSILSIQDIQLMLVNNVFHDLTLDLPKYDTTDIFIAYNATINDIIIYNIDYYDDLRVNVDIGIDYNTSSIFTSSHVPSDPAILQEDIVYKFARNITESLFHILEFIFTDIPLFEHNVKCNENGAVEYIDPYFKLSLDLFVNKIIHDILHEIRMCYPEYENIRIDPYLLYCNDNTMQQYDIGICLDIDDSVILCTGILYK